MSARPPPPASSAAFRTLMSRWATGVAVVTARDGATDAGLTVNALLSVSLHPPSVLVSLMRDVDTLPVIERSRAFAVNFLSADQRPLSERFARPVPPVEKFRELPFHRSPGGIALLDGTLGALECRVTSLTPALDHILVIGEVVHDELGVPALPLLFYQSGYGEAAGPATVRLPPPRA